MNLSGLLDVNELVQRVVKYLEEGLMVALASYAIPKKLFSTICGVTP